MKFIPVLCFILSSIFRVGVSVEILDLKIPYLVESGSRDIELDCDYDYEDLEKQQLDVKWYFNDSPSPFYSWVPGRMSHPRIIGDLFQKHLDINHTVHKDVFKRHRALLIKKATKELSGIYTCKVSTFVSEDVQRKKMIIYSPASSVLFIQERSSDGRNVNISCEARGIFPQPQIKLTWGSFQFDDSEASVTISREGNYDIIVHRMVDHRDIPSKTIFGCVLTIPGIDYKVREEAVYQHRSGRYSNPEHRISSGCKLNKDIGIIWMSLIVLLTSTNTIY